MNQRETTTPGIPDIREDNVLDVLRALKSTLQVREGRSGDALDQNVTYRHLAALGLVDPKDGSSVGDGGNLPVGPPGSGGGYDPHGDLSTPPAPTGLVVTGGFTALYLYWNPSGYANHAFTEVWRSGEDLLEGAVMVGTSPGDLYTDPAELESVFYYWIRFRSLADVVGPYNSTTGTRGQTGMDIGKAIEALSSSLLGSPLYATLSQRIEKIETDAIIANRSAKATLDVLEDRLDLNVSRILHLNDVTSSQANSLSVLESRGPSGNRTFFGPERPDAESLGSVAGIPLLAGDVWYDTDDANRSYRWSGTAWVEFTSTTGTKVYHQPTDPNVGGGADSTGRLLRDGDIWYDSDSVPPNHPWLWQTVPGAWADIAGGDNSASIITLEQTKIGYATLNVTSPHGPAGAVFDFNGLIWNNVASGDPVYSNSVQKWNTTHTDNPGVDSKLTWHVGLPFAKATKQVGISADGGLTTAIVEQQFTALKTTDTGLLLQYTVKLDNNGYIAGFGLASTAGNGPPTSAFIVNADTFGIGPPIPSGTWSAGLTYAKNDLVKKQQAPGSGPIHVFQSRQANNTNHTPVWGATKAETDPWWVDLSVRLPFMVSTVAQVIDGKTYPPGVWMNSANIADASITNAQIGSLTADKIVTGELFATIYVRTGKIFNGVDPSKPFPSGPSAGTGWGTGYFLGDHGGTNKFFVGSEPLNNWMSWNGSQFEVRGHIVGTSGSIGGTNMAFGTLFSTGVTNISNGTGFFLDSTGLFRVGNPVGSEIVWDGLGISIYDKNHALVMSSGQINWSAISGSPPAGIINTNISMNVNGTLNGAGGGQVTPAGIGAINTAGTNAPNSLLNSAITVTTNPSTGSIVFSGGPSSTGLNGIAMAGFRIDAANITNYLANAAIVTAVIGNAAVGNAQIANLAVTNAKIADLTVDTLKIGNNAVMIPSTNGYTFDEGVTATETVLFGGPVTGGAVVEFALTSMATLLNVLFVTELVQQNPTTGGSCTVVCYLNKRSDPNFVITRAFTVGIINNQPRFAQTASFSFINVPGLAVGDRYFMHISAKRNDSNGGQMIFGSKTITVSAHKK